MKFFSLESDPVLALNVLPAVDGVGVEPVGDAGGGAVDVLAGHCLKTIGNERLFQIIFPLQSLFFPVSLGLRDVEDFGSYILPENSCLKAAELS